MRLCVFRTMKCAIRRSRLHQAAYALIIKDVFAYKRRFIGNVPKAIPETSDFEDVRVAKAKLL